MPHALCSIAARLFACVTTHFVENYLTVDLEIQVSTGTVSSLNPSAQDCLDFLHTTVGMHLEETKSKVASQTNNLLGVHAELLRTHTHHEVVLRQTEEQMKKILLSFTRRQDDTSRNAGPSRKTQFCLQTGGGQIGRAATLLLVERASAAYNMRLKLHMCVKGQKEVHKTSAGKGYC